MRAIVTFVSIAIALLWSAVVWGGYGLLLASTEFVARNAGDAGLPPDVSGAAGMLHAVLQDYGTGAAAGLWAVGLLAIILLRALINLLIGAAGPDRSDVGAAAVVSNQQVLPRRTEIPRPPTGAPPNEVPQPARWGRNASR